MRIAWVGPAPRDDHGVPYVATQLLLGLVHRGVEVDGFCVAGPEELPGALLGVPGLTWILRDAGWRWDRWYSRGPASAYVTRESVRAAGQRLLLGAVAERHRLRRYDLVYRFSGLELATGRSAVSEFPPS
jgi:hypothetical protein